MKTRTNGFLNETNKIKNLIKKIIREQFESPEPDSKECLKTYVRMALTTTDFDGREIMGGGDLGLWNKNKLPLPSDENAFRRFVNYMKKVSKKGSAIYDYEECDGIFFEDMKPYLKPIYLEVLSDFSPNKRKPSNIRMGGNDETLQTILDIAMRTPQEDYDDPFDWLNVVFSDVEWEMDDESGELRSKYGSEVLDLWGS
jgi:hypothetical protein